jgi:hypothetical protein
MQLRSYAKKHQLSTQDIIDALTSKYGGTWVVGARLTDQIINFLDSTFGNSQPQLPQAKETLQLPQATFNTPPTEETSITPSEPKNLTITEIPHAQLATTELEELKTSIRTQLIKESAEIAAIRDYQLHKGTYEGTQRALIVNDIYAEMDQQKAIREQFQQSQQEYQSTRQFPASKDFLKEYLDIWNDDSTSHTSLVKNILGKI